MREICELVLEGEREPRADEAQIRFSRAFGELDPAWTVGRRDSDDPLYVARRRLGIASD